MFRAESHSHGIATEVIAADSLSEQGISWVMCDASRAAQILVNLYTNAIKFTKEEAARKITVRYGVSQHNPRQAFSNDIHWAASSAKEPKVEQHEWDKEELYLTFSISDTGIGMTSQEMRHLFDRFQQATPKTQVKYGGSGLGLFISRQLAEAHGGSLGVMSEVHQGSTFAFYLRVSRTGPPSDMANFPDTKPSTDAVQRDQRGQLETMVPAKQIIHVLVVEDNDLNARILKAQLIKQGCVVSVAGNGVECLERLRDSDIWRDKNTSTTQIDMILMDVEMPIMDGLTCTREIRRLEGHGDILRHIDIIATTANARSEQVDSALDAGIDAVLPKPFMVKDLMMLMRERLGAREPQ